jgi:small-conductance mechanosensitive channel
MAKRNRGSKGVELEPSEKRALEILRRISSMGRDLTVGEAVEEISRSAGIPSHKAVKILSRLREKGAIAILDPEPPHSFLRYLFSSRAAWFWLASAALLTLNIIIYMGSGNAITQLARYILGSVCVLYIPGSMLVELLYPARHDLSPLERLALSIGLSLALVPLVGLMLNYTPWGIRLEPVLTSITALSIALGLGAVRRKQILNWLASWGSLGGGKR